MRQAIEIPIGRLSELLAYDPASGALTWRVAASRRVNPGDVAGAKNSGGYVHIQIGRRKFKAHRVAWALATGAWPKFQIDHINRKRDDNRLENLREDKFRRNSQNASDYKSNSTGFRGVYARNGKFFSQIKADGVTYWLGNFDSAEEASAAFARAKTELHPFAMEARP